MNIQTRLEKKLTRFGLDQIGGLAPGKSAVATLPMMPSIEVKGEKLTLREFHLTQYVPCQVGPIVATNSRMETKNIYLYQICDWDAAKILEKLS